MYVMKRKRTKKDKRRLEQPNTNTSLHVPEAVKSWSRSEEIVHTYIYQHITVC